jgi:hypothetical protein
MCHNSLLPSLSNEAKGGSGNCLVIGSDPNDLTLAEELQSAQSTTRNQDYSHVLDKLDGSRSHFFYSRKTVCNDIKLKSAMSLA